MKKLLSALFLFFVMTTMAVAQPGYFTPDIESIRRANKLVVVMTKFDNPPFYSGTPDKMIGLDVDIANQIGRILNVSVEFRRDAATFQETVEQVRNKQADIAISKLSITGPRMTMVRFTQPYVQLRQAMVVNRLWMSQNANGRTSSEIIRTFNGPISFIRGSSYDTFARANFPNATYHPESSWDNVINGVMEGRYAAAYRDDFEIKRVATERPSASISTRTVVIQDSLDNIAAAVHPDSQQLLSITNFVIQNNFNNITVESLIKRLREEQR